jgi:sensor histidine kinase YesM
VLGVEDDAGQLAALARPGGIGLANLRARLAALYGDAARLELTSRPQGGVRAVVRFPC